MGNNAMKHTKGPWALKDTGGEFFIPEINVSFLRSHSTDKKKDEEIRKNQQGQTELANAQLMAAAPDMYEALKEFENQLPELWGDGIRNGKVTLTLDADVIDGIMDAIRKAEGRTD